jgi:hypothetical protein
MEKEIFVDSPVYGDEYSIGNYGSVYSKRTGKILRQKKNNMGYPLVIIYRDSVAKTCLVSRLVAFAFNGADINDKSLCACHKNDIPSDNRADNLFIGTRSQNMKDCAKKLRNVGQRKILTKHSDEKIFNIIKEKGNKKATVVALEYGVTWSYVYMLWRGESRARYLNLPQAQ